MNRLIYIAIISLSLAWGNTPCHGAETITYKKADSIKVIKLLTEGLQERHKNSSKNMMLFYAHKLIGLPYVAHTLEVNKTEKLVVNLRQLDCTTYVETVLALSMTTKQNSTHWEDFCRNLITIRYRNGKVEGYASRNHYFLWWAENNKAKSIVTLPLNELKKKSIYEVQTININYMSTHADAYKMLASDRKAQAQIAKYEQQSKGRTMRYIPRANLGYSKTSLQCVKSGDILAICTKKAGLDTTHIGIAEWGDDGKLHLLNASQVHREVVLEKMTLQQYMKKHPSQLGVWVLHVE